MSIAVLLILTGNIIDDKERNVNNFLRFMEKTLLSAKENDVC